MDETGRRFNWDDVERDYTAGLLPLGVICAKYGLSMANLNRVAAKQNWVRQKVDPPPPVVPAGGGVPAQTLIDETEARAIQGRQLLQVLREHQRDVNKVRGLSNLLFERLSLFLMGTDLQVPFIGARESPADLLLKLAKVNFSAVRLEREILGLSNGAPLGDDDNDMADEWENLKKELDSALTAKVIDVHDDG